MTIGEYIKEQRIQKGLTQEELASKTGVSIRTIQRIENGDVDPRSFTLQSISEALGIEYDKLMGFYAQDKNAPPSKDDHLWIGFLHLSGLFLMIIPSIIIWMVAKDRVKGIRAHAIDVINFQLSMLIYIIPSSFLAILIIGLPFVIFFGFFSSIVIVINTIKVLNNQSYKYPLTIKILKL